MKRPRPHAWRLLTAVVLLVTAGVLRAEPATVTFYDKDPQHLWNRLYAALTVAEPGGKSLPPDLVDQPWPNLKQLESEPAHSTALALLREFVKSGPRPDTMSPLHRAMMQRDLLNAFHTLARRQQWEKWIAPRRALLPPLVQAIRHAALTAEEIKKLPDNYAAAAAAPDAVTVYDPAKPAAFLPKDLLADDGPWIALGTKRDTTVSNGSVAHFHFESFGGRTSFEVRMRHPGGRAAGIAYLKSLEDMKEPIVKTDPQAGRQVDLSIRGDEPRWYNPDTPQFPAGTMWALVRRTLLVDTAGKIVAAPLVESVQMRVYRAPDASAARESASYKTELAALQASGGKFDSDELILRHYQTVFMWELRRSTLLSGKAGYHLSTQEDLRYFPLMSNEGAIPLSLFCTACHAGPNIFSIGSRQGAFRQMKSRPPDFIPSTREKLDAVTTGFAGNLPAWVLLGWLWVDQP